MHATLCTSILRDQILSITLSALGGWNRCDPSFLPSESPLRRQDLEYRRMCLGAESIQHLCKSIIMENTKLDAEDAVGTSKYYCVVVQAGSPIIYPLQYVRA